MFALSHIRGADNLGAWNRLLSCIMNKLPHGTNNTVVEICKLS